MEILHCKNGDPSNACFTCRFCVCVFIFGAVMLSIGLVVMAETAPCDDLDADFPIMSNDNHPAGTCAVIRLWHRNVDHVNSENTPQCFDQYAVEFAWLGGPSNGKPAIESETTSIDAGGNDLYGGWRAGSS